MERRDDELIDRAIEEILWGERPLYRVLEPRMREATVYAPRSFNDDVELVARMLSSKSKDRLRWLDSNEIVKHRLQLELAFTLSLLDKERSHHKHMQDNLRDLEFMFRQELDRVTANRAYRGFGYSEEIKRRLLAVEREKRDRLSDHERSVDRLHGSLFSLVIELFKGTIGADHELATILATHGRHLLDRR